MLLRSTVALILRTKLLRVLALRVSINFRGERPMNALDYEAWRPALIAFYWHESPWMRQKLENLERNEPLTAEDKHVIDGLVAAQKVAA